MPSLRVHAKDAAIGMTNQANCELMADSVALVARWASHKLWGRFCPLRAQAGTLRLLAASLARVKGVPEIDPAQFDARVRIAMKEPRCD